MKKKSMIILMGALMCAMSLWGCSGAGSDATVERTSRETLDTAIDGKEEKSLEKTEEKFEEKSEEKAGELPAGYKRSDSYTISKLTSFSTTTIYGDDVDENIFADKEYTLVNIWGTFCGPCIGEMPELQKLYEDMPDNMQMIGIVCDVYPEDKDMADVAIGIVKDTGVTYPNLIYCDEMNDYLYNVQYIPTTFVVDSEGYVLAEVIVGADVNSYKKIIEDLGK